MHLTQKAVEKHLSQGKPLHAGLLRVGEGARVTQSKISEEQALQKLDLFYGAELVPVYREMEQFRDAKEALLTKQMLFTEVLGFLGLRASSMRLLSEQ